MPLNPYYIWLKDIYEKTIFYTYWTIINFQKTLSLLGFMGVKVTIYSPPLYEYSENACYLGLR